MLEGIWWVSYAALWVLFVLEAAMILALARQIGIIHERLGPAGARMMNPGPQIGDPAPPLDVTDLFGRFVTLGSVRGKRTLLFFLSPTCATCKQLLPVLKTLNRTEKNSIEVVLLSIGSHTEAAHQYAQEHRLEAFPLVVSDEPMVRYQVGLAPYAVMVDKEGIIRAKGLVNNFNQLESLLNAEEIGHSSIQSLLVERGELAAGSQLAKPDGNT